MQTSGSSSSTSGTVRAAGLAGAIGLAILISGTWSSGCTPGEPNCSELGTLCTAGAGGGGAAQGAWAEAEPLPRPTNAAPWA